MTAVFSVALGGALGALGRFGLASAVQRLSAGVFPWGTMTVNLLGAFCIGFLAVLFGRTMVPPALRMGLLAGFLGSFTTFSTYMLESIRLIQDGEYGPAALNLLLGNAAGLAAVLAGMFAARALFVLLRGGAV